MEIARAMKVDVLIVVDVSFPLYASEELTSPIEITNQAFAILIRGRTRQQRALLGPNDIVIEPPLGRFPSADFARVPQALGAGETGAREQTASLQKLALSPDAYVRYLATRNPRDASLPTIEFVRADPRSMEYDALVKATMSNLIGKPMDADLVRNRLSSLYALDRFESIDYNLIEEGGRAGLELDLKRKSWGPNYVRFGLNLEDNFEGTSRYNAALRFIATELNPLGAEWLTDLQIGDNPKLFTEFYQPLSLASRYFIAPSIDFEERSVFQLGGDRQDLLAEYRVRTLQGGLDVGREISNWGEVRFGMRRGTGRSRVLIGDPTLPVDEFDRGGYFARFSYDRLDSIFFPRHGQQFEFQWRGERENIGSEENLNAFETSWLVARSFDRHTLIFWLEGGTTRDAELARPENFYSLGGFLNLSGLPPGYLAGPHYGIGRLIYQRRVGRGGAGVLDFPAYAGLSFEAGNTWLDSSDVRFGDLRKNFSVFFGVDSPLGPVYLATGYDAEEHEKAFYLFLGRTLLEAVLRGRPSRTPASGGRPGGSTHNGRSSP